MFCSTGLVCLQDVTAWEAASEKQYYVAQVYHDVFQVCLKHC